MSTTARTNSMNTPMSTRAALPVPTPMPSAHGHAAHGHAAHGSEPRFQDLARVSTHKTGAAERGVTRLLERLDHGTLTIHRRDGRVQTYGRSLGALQAHLNLHNDAVFARVLAHGDIGLAEAYLDGDWDTPDLPMLLELFMRNRDALDRAVYGRAIASWIYRVRHALRANTRSGSKRNIQAHYDLGNDFYRLWLDPSMNYSSAWFNGDTTTSLTQAQEAKMDRALDEVGAGPGTRILEIGCGWGAVAERAAARGAHLTGVTLSSEQLAWGHERLQRAGHGERSDLRLQDYRDLGQEPGFVPYDAIVSIEMFEAVGRAYWAGYFQTLRRCLAPGGRACIQSITIRDDLYPRYLRSTDFIQQYVFPGGLLPSAQAFRGEAAKAGLAVERELSFGEDYAQTLQRWRASFLAALPQVRAQGFDARFVRLWDFYLAYCQAAFATGNTNVVQFTLRHA